MDGLAALPPEDALYKRAARPPSHQPPLTIIAPTPRRHLIDSSQSQHWLASPSPSPDVSPFTTEFPRSPSSTASKRTAGSPKSHRRSFSSLYAHEKAHNPARGLRQRQSSNASIASTYTVHGGYLSSSGSNLHKSLLRAKKTQSQAQLDATENASMGRRWIRYMHKRGLRSWVVPTAIAFATLLKLCLGVGSYSGEATPPMYGDYEAQRHWMEITTHLPFREWYTYDLQYWGLDYPPLTAYVSWICGYIGSYINPAWFALDTSRGIESPGSKLYMRLTVLFFDLLIYIPALLLFTRTWHSGRSKRTQEQALLLLLLQPALLLIDNGHFQYNSVMLGLTLLAINFFARGEDVLGAVCFVGSLGFKQMALYYAPAVGSYLLAKCIYLGPKNGTKLFTRLALTTALSFALLFAPFFLPPFAPSPLHILHPIQRIFPFARGLFEDKVANFWCASDVLVKWRRLAGEGDAGRAWLVRVSMGLTALGFAPSVVGVLRCGWVMRVRDGEREEGVGVGDENNDDTTIRDTQSRHDPSIKASATNSSTTLAATASSTTTTKSTANPPPPFLPLLPYALLSSAMSFFLFSFQVHEKTILLPLLPLTLVASGAQPGTALHCWGVLGNNVAVFSMWPLLKRDGLAVPYIALVVLWNRVVGYNPFVRPEVDFVQLLSLATYATALALHALELVVPPPARYPDLFPVLNVLVSTPVFVLIWMWSIKSGVEVLWALGGLTSSGSRGSVVPSSSSAAVGLDGAASHGAVSHAGKGGVVESSSSTNFADVGGGGGGVEVVVKEAGGVSELGSGGGRGSYGGGAVRRRREGWGYEGGGFDGS